MADALKTKILCEVMGDASPWLQGDKFDGTMNYTFRDLALRFFARSEIDGPSFLDGASRMWAQYSWSATLTSQNLLSSHDTPRFLTECGGEIWRLKLATVFQLTFPGAPGIYYGDEIGLEGGDDPGSRGAFPKDALPVVHEIHSSIKDLVALRRIEPALVDGEWRPLIGEGGLVVFERRRGGRRVVVAINMSDRARSIEMEEVSEILWGDGLIDGTSLVIEPRSAVVA